MGPTGESVTGGPGRYVRKVSGCGNLSPWGPLSILGEPDMWWGAHILGTLIDEWRRALVVGHLSVRDSMKGALRESSFTGEPKMMFLRDMQNVL